MTNQDKWPFNKFIIGVQHVKGNVIADTTVPEYYLVLTSKPDSTDDFLTPFISRLLDYRWRFNEFLLFHYVNSKNKIALLDFLTRVEFNLTYQFINNQISGELHEVIAESEIEEYLNVVKGSIKTFVDSQRSTVPVSFKLTKDQVCELTIRVFLAAKVIRESNAKVLQDVLMENRTPKQLITQI